jgi:hypothetical protein
VVADYFSLNDEGSELLRDSRLRLCNYFHQIKRFVFILPLLFVIYCKN